MAPRDPADQGLVHSRILHEHHKNCMHVVIWGGTDRVACTCRAVMRRCQRDVRQLEGRAEDNEEGTASTLWHCNCPMVLVFCRTPS